MINRYEAKEILKKLQDCLEHDACETTDCMYFKQHEDLQKLREYLENSVQVVCCKDCKWCKYDKNGTYKRMCAFNGLNNHVFDVFYCFNGERKEEQ